MNQTVTTASANVACDVTVPAGYDIVVCAWFMNTDDQNSGIDNFQIQRTSTGVARLANGTYEPGGYAFVPSRQMRSVAAGHYVARATTDQMVRTVPVEVCR